MSKQAEYVFLIEKEGKIIRSAMVLPVGDNRIYNATHGKGRYRIGKRKDFKQLHRVMLADFDKSSPIPPPSGIIRRLLAFFFRNNL